MEKKQGKHGCLCIVPCNYIIKVQAFTFAYSTLSRDFHADTYWDKLKFFFYKYKTLILIQRTDVHV